MAREIKFRGLRTDGKGWVYGFYFYDHYVDLHYIIDDTSNVEVIPESVGQFTGFFDCNGNEIYEGDKLRKDSGSYWVVVWSKSDCGFRCYKYVKGKDEEGNSLWIRCDQYPLGHSLIGLLTYNNFVLGNIHQTNKKENSNG